MWNSQMVILAGAALIALAALISDGPRVREGFPFFSLKFLVKAAGGGTKAISVLTDANKVVVAADWSSMQKSIRAGEFTADDALKGINDAVNKGDINPVNAGDLIKKLNGLKNAPASNISTKFDDIASKSLNLKDLDSQMMKRFNDMSAAEKADFAKTGFDVDTLVKLQSKYANTGAGKKALQDLYKKMGLTADGYPKQGGVRAWAEKHWGKLSAVAAGTLALFFLASELTSFIESRKRGDGGDGGGGGGSGGSGVFGGNSDVSLALFIFLAVGGFVCCCVVGVLAYYMSQKNQ